MKKKLFTLTKLALLMLMSLFLTNDDSFVKNEIVLVEVLESEREEILENFENGSSKEIRVFQEIKNKKVPSAHSNFLNFENQKREYLNIQNKFNFSDYFANTIPLYILYSSFLVYY